MPQLREKHLPHRVDYRTPAQVALRGTIPGILHLDRPAFVEDSQKLVIDERPGSDTHGKEITAQTMVIVLLDDDMLPGSEVTVWKGTARERTSQVVVSKRREYNHRTPNHVELWLE